LYARRLQYKLQVKNAQDLGTRLLVYCTRIKLGSAFYTNNIYTFNTNFEEILKESVCGIQLHKAMAAR